MDSTGMPAASGQAKRYAFEFSATAGQYFRIWIVNLVLTILTLGIYSAWAKVRKKRYFYGHTKIDGDAFEYRGQPMAILKGRLIAVAFVVVFYGAGYVAPLLYLAILPAAILFLPWLVVRSLAFNAHNTVYRNIRLRFEGTYGTCLKRVLGYGLVTILTLGLAYPYLKFWLVDFATRNYRYGNTKFEMADFKKEFIRAYSHAYGYGMLLGLLIVGLGFALGANPKEGSMVTTLVAYAGYILIFGFIRANTINATLNHLSIGPVTFESALKVREMCVLYLTNIIAIVFTLGLASPWAAVRTMRYRAANLTLVAAGGLEGFVNAESAAVGAAGEEVAEMFDIDIGL